MSNITTLNKLIDEDIKLMIPALSKYPGARFNKMDLRDMFNLSHIRSYMVYNRLRQHGFIVTRFAVQVPNQVPIQDPKPSDDVVII